MIMAKKKPYEKPECKKLFIPPMIKKGGKMNKFIGTRLERDNCDCDCDCPECPAPGCGPVGCSCGCGGDWS